MRKDKGTRRPVAQAYGQRMRTVVLLKRSQTWPERDQLRERHVLHLVLAEGSAEGKDLTVTASEEAYQLAQEMDPLTPVMVDLEIEETLYRGSSARLKATAIDQIETPESPNLAPKVQAAKSALRRLGR